jgi:glutamate racemase
MNRPIGIFDSGIGGLTVLRELKKRLPYENTIYLGDTARVPYGTKSKETIIRFTTESVLFLLSKDVKLIIIACNTSSSLALGVLKKNFKVPILGVIQPGAKEAVYATRNRRIGVIGTRATIESYAYEEEIKKLDSKIQVFSQACPLFVPLVEEGLLNGRITFEIAREYLEPLKKADVDTLILGCTHYPLLKSPIRRIMGKSVTLIDSAKQVACEVKDLLLSENLLNPQKKRACRDLFYVTDEPKYFSELAKLFLGYKIKRVEKVSL